MNKDRTTELRIITIAAVLTMIFGFFIIKASITGFVVLDLNNTHVDNINFVSGSNTNYTWIPEEIGVLNSVKVSGYFEGDSFKVNLKDKLIYSYGYDNFSYESAVVTNSSGEIYLSFNYGGELSFDNNNNGITSRGDIIDFSINPSFNFNVDYDNLCTRYTVDNLDDELSYGVCYGDLKCCNFLNLEPSSNIWNDTFYLNYGKYGASYNNTVTAQVVYYDINLSVPYSNVYNSESLRLDAKFIDGIDFDLECIDTCELYLENNSYDLEIIVDGNLIISNLTYTLGISEVNITNETINLTNVTLVNITNQTFYNLTNQTINATNVTLNITNKTISYLKQYKAVVGMPVRWVKNVKLNKTVSNFSINITNFATNITIEKIVNDDRIKINKNKIKIRDKDGLKSLKDYEKNKTSKKTKEIVESDLNTTEIIIEENVSEVLVEYLTEPPVSVENIIDNYRKEIIISSNVHYENILAFTNISPEVKASSIKLYRTTDGIKELVSISMNDTNNNSLIDYISWIVPSLSNQTYELEISVLNIQSYPTVGGEWEVRFNTTGTANLTIKAVNFTSYSEIHDNISTEDDLEIFDLKCNNSVVNISLVNSNGTKMPFDVYKIKRRMEWIENRLNDLK